MKHRLGIDYETIKAFNRGIVYASISGFGQDGPLSKRPGFDQIAQAYGRADVNHTAVRRAQNCGVGKIPIADLNRERDLPRKGAMLATDRCTENR